MKGYYPKVRGMMTKRKRYTKEFKLDAVRLVTEQGYRRAEAGRNLGINANRLGRWAQEFLEDDGQAFRGNGKLMPAQQARRRLRVENRQLKLECEILKKATACFAKELS